MSGGWIHDNANDHISEVVYKFMDPMEPTNGLENNPPCKLLPAGMVLTPWWQALQREALYSMIGKLELPQKYWHGKLCQGGIDVCQRNGCTQWQVHGEHHHGHSIAICHHYHHTNWVCPMLLSCNR